MKFRDNSLGGSLSLFNKTDRRGLQRLSRAAWKDTKETSIRRLGLCTSGSEWETIEGYFEEGNEFSCAV
jgi:hypothetical protein